VDVVIEEHSENFVYTLPRGVSSTDLAKQRQRRRKKKESMRGGTGLDRSVSYNYELEYTRASAMRSLKARGNVGLSTDRYNKISQRSDDNSESALSDSVLSQFSPYLIEAISQRFGSGKERSRRTSSSPLPSFLPLSSPNESERGDYNGLGSSGGDHGNNKKNNPLLRRHRSAPDVIGKCFGELGHMQEHEFLPSHLHGAPTKKTTKQALEMFHNMHIYDSQNYEPSDSKLDRTAALNLPRRHYILSNAYRWLLALAIGLCMGVVTFVMYTVMSLLIQAKLTTTQNLIRDNKTPGAIAFFVGMAFVFALGATVPVSYLQPIAGGSGIAEMKVYLNGIHVPGLLRISTFATKAFSLCCSIPSGMVVGTAGPYVHLGAIVGGGLGSLGSNKFKFKLNKKHVDFQTKFAHRSFVVIGIAAGIATVFTAPIGGVLIAFEDCGSFYLGSTKMFWQCFLATCAGVYINYVLHLLYMEKGDIMSFDFTEYTRAFALYDDVTATYSRVYRFTWWEVFVFAMMGAVSGLAGSVFVYFHMRVHIFRTRYLPASVPWMRMVEALALALVTAGISITICYFSPCVPLPQNVDDYPDTLEEVTLVNDTATDYPYNPHLNELWCPDGFYSSYGTIFLNPAGISLREILHLGETVDQQNQFTTSALLAYFFFLYVFLILTYGSAIAGGTMVPLLTIGSAYGRLCAKLLTYVMANTGSAQAATRISYSTYAVIGAACFQSAASRMTLSIAVLVLETTGALELTIPLMIAIFFAKMVGDWTGTGLYDAYIALKGVPYLPEDEISYEQKMIAEKLDVEEIMTTDLVCLPSTPTVGHVVQVLKTSKHSAFPVLQSSQDHNSHGSNSGGCGSQKNSSLCDTDSDDDDALYLKPKKMLGYISRSQLLNMLDKGIGLLEGDEMSYDLSTSHEEILGLVEDLKDVPVKRDQGGQDEVIRSLSQEDTELRLDLRPFMQLDPCVISSDANVAKAYRLFQKMGLSHLYVSPSGAQPIVGVITRKDLTLENCQLQLGERASYEMKVMRSRGENGGGNSGDGPQGEV
jgi:chloride channel 7